MQKTSNGSVRTIWKNDRTVTILKLNSKWLKVKTLRITEIYDRRQVGTCLCEKEDSLKSPLKML